jgi:type IV pilus assembly protein PilA
VSSATSHSLCGTATPVPMAAVPAGKKYQPNTTEGQDFETGDTGNGWKCVKFGMSQPHYYQYLYVAGGGIGEAANPAACGSGECYTAGAVGDLDGNSVYSRFARTGEVNPSTHRLKASTQVYIENEFE